MALSLSLKPDHNPNPKPNPNPNSTQVRDLHLRRDMVGKRVLVEYAGEAGLVECYPGVVVAYSVANGLSVLYNGGSDTW